MNPSSVESQVQFESLISFSMPEKSSKLARWERKKKAAKIDDASYVKKAPKTAAACVEKTNNQTPSSKRGLKRSSSSISAGTPRSARRSSRKRQACEDRFIHSRSAMDTDELHFHLTRTESQNSNNDTENEHKQKADSPTTKAYKRTLKRELTGKANDHQVLAYTKRTTVPIETQRMGNVLFSQNKSDAGKRVQKTTIRHIPEAPERILDAPDLESDYYLNLLDWSSQNVLAVALGPTVYLWNATDGSIQELTTLQETNDGPIEKVCSVSWVPGDGNFLAVGTSDSKVQLWDVNECKLLRSMGGHGDRVSSLSWNSHVLSSGSRDSCIINHDVRVRDHNISTFKHHSQEVCGLKWSPDGSTLASGANDNLVCLWDNKMSSGVANQAVAPRLVLNEHQAAVKALAWAPFRRNLLATGGGTADRTIKFWNTDTGSRLNSIDTGSQVCSLMWSPNHRDKEILSSHGYSENQLCLWKYPTMTKIKELKGHSERVLHLAQAPDGVTVCSASADETLRFWRIFSQQSKSKGRSRGLLNNYKSIR